MKLTKHILNKVHVDTNNSAFYKICAFIFSRLKKMMDFAIRIKISNIIFSSLFLYILIVSILGG